MKMANKCHIALSFPLEAIPEPQQKEQLLELNENIKQNGLRAAAPGASATIREINGEAWVTPYFDIHIASAGNVSVPLWMALDSLWSFKHSFPWWAQIGFAGAEKNSGTQKINSSPIAYLEWELPVKDVIRNLKYAIKVHKNFPISTKLASWKWVEADLRLLQETLLWFNTAYGISDRTIATLDWSEVAWMGLTEAQASRNNDPNDLMADVKKLNSDIRKLKAGNTTLRTFERKYAEAK
jgi:hypothetical protein